MINIVVVDDQEIVRAGFGALLATQPDFAVVATASDGDGAIRACQQHRCDVVLMDVRMPGMDGIEATRQIVASVASVPRILMLTTFDLDEYVYDALSAGASGFLLKDVTGQRLVDGVRLVAEGSMLLGPSVSRRLVADFASRPAQGVVDLAARGVSARESEVLLLLARGLSNAEIADALVIGVETVKSHVAEILRKLELRDRIQAVVFAYENGLVIRGE